SKGIIDKADIVIVEVNEHLPWLCGGFDEVVHISQVDYVVEGEHEPLFELPIQEPSELDKKIAASIVPYIKDGSCLQLGIGSMPNSVGNMIANSDLKDLSMHTELCSDAYYDLYAAGKLTNARNNMHRNKGMFGMAFGTKKLYEWMDRNPGLSVCPLEYVNSPELIGAIDNMVAINNCISVDLYGQVSSESSGTRHISGTGGQLDFMTGAAKSKGGKAFICLTSTFTDKKGQMHSRIVPHFGGDIVTTPRSEAYYVVTEYGVRNLVGRTTWERAAMLVDLAHPAYREELIAAAEKQNIWRQSNKR
ncbi:MAG: butyryl-CoA:acetate CoA-transferase, partial [Clostridia bacterium]|nr:butyryl-CoA:acetate CoA-transferase [Clostridia bacterium]